MTFPHIFPITKGFFNPETLFITRIQEWKHNLTLGPRPTF